MLSFTDAFRTPVFQMWHDLMTNVNHQRDPQIVGNEPLTIDMPGITHVSDIDVIVRDQNLTIMAEEHPFDVVGDKYYKRYKIADGRVLISVVFRNGVLELHFAKGKPRYPAIQHPVRDLRDGDQNGNSGNTRPI